MSDKKGLSGVVSVMVIIAVVMAAGIMVWTFVESTLEDRMDETEACNDAREKVNLDNDYTCYNITAGENDEVRFKIDVGEISVDEIKITITSEAYSKNYELTKTAKEYTNLKPYPERSGTVTVPGKGIGKTYIVNDFPINVEENEETTLRISIAPTIEGHKCGTADSIKNVYSCSSFI